jgi:myo-inositol-1(or 4)-monophosphatase
MHAFVNTAVNAAIKAGKIITRAFDNPEDIEVSTKSANDFVSNVDLASEQMLIHVLQEAYPEHAFYCEENTSQGKPDTDHVWIIDPLDGTSNFINGYPHFCISIALKINGRVEHAVVYDPLHEDLYTASYGRGAQCNNRKIRVNKTPFLSQASVGCVLPPSRAERHSQFYDTTKDVSENCRRIRIAGAAALDLSYVAAGRLDAFYSIGLKEWDIAAASLIIKEAGGLVVDFAGQDNYLDSGNIIAGSPKVIKELVPHLKGLLK